MKYRLIYLLILLLTVVPYFVNAQERNKRDWGHLSGSLESNSGLFFKDKKTGNKGPEDKFAANTWLNLGYSIRNFRFGLQYEIYEPPMPGFPVELKGNKLMQGFAEYSGSSFSVRLGNVYEQFGCGLQFRAFEERGLGMNNSLLGVRLQYTPWHWFSVKTVAGLPRRYLTYSDTRVYGVDGELLLSDCLSPDSECSYSLGGGWLGRDDHTHDILVGSPRFVYSWAGRANINYHIFSLDGEYVRRGNAVFFNLENGKYVVGKGSALLLNLGIDAEWMNLSAVFRRLENMEFRVNNSMTVEQVGLNYIPALTRQHKYTLPALYPYITQAEEIGGQVDLFKEFRNSATGKSLFKMNINASYYNALATNAQGSTEFFAMNGSKLFREAGIELEKKLGAWKAILYYDWQSYSKGALHIGPAGSMICSHIVVGDITYKITPKNSLRFELQHMLTDMEGDKAWWAGLLEWGLAPCWSFYVQDMCNYDTENESVHYYTAGGAWTRGIARVALSWGRNRAGYSCVGGVCRFVPEYTGVNLTLNITF